MNTATGLAQRGAAFELRFLSLFNEGRGLAFPCDRDGRVDVDRLPARARTNYLGARALVGREFTTPMLLAVAPR
jgi:hypothetical protein